MSRLAALAAGIRSALGAVRGYFQVEKDLKESGAWGQLPEHPNCRCATWKVTPDGRIISECGRTQLGDAVLLSAEDHDWWMSPDAGRSWDGLYNDAFVLDFRRILADYNRSVLEAKSPAARGKLAAPAFYAILEAARLHGIQPVGTETQGEQGTKERKEA